MSEQTVKRRYRKEWEQYNGQIIPPGVSPTKDDDVWEAEHLEDYVVRSGGLSACHIDMKDEELSIPE